MVVEGRKKLKNVKKAVTEKTGKVARTAMDMLKDRRKELGRELQVRADASASEVYGATRTSPVSRRLGSRRQKGGTDTGWRQRLDKALLR